MSNRIAQAMRDHGLIEAVIPDSDLRAINAAKQGLMPNGQVVPKAGEAIRTPMILSFGATSGIRERAARAGNGILFATHAATAPTSQLIVRLWAETPTSGRTLIHVQYHPAGQRIYENEVSLPVLAGSWWDVDIQAAGGASGVSASFVVNVG